MITIEQLERGCVLRVPSDMKLALAVISFARSIEDGSLYDPVLAARPIPSTLSTSESFIASAKKELAEIERLNARGGASPDLWRRATDLKRSLQAYERARSRSLEPVVEVTPPQPAKGQPLPPVPRAKPIPPQRMPAPTVAGGVMRGALSGGPVAPDLRRRTMDETRADQQARLRRELETAARNTEEEQRRQREDEDDVE
jgi:hypothetical protein